MISKLTAGQLWINVYRQKKKGGEKSFGIVLEI